MAIPGFKGSRIECLPGMSKGLGYISINGNYTHIYTTHMHAHVYTWV